MVKKCEVALSQELYKLGVFISYDLAFYLPPFIRVTNLLGSLAIVTGRHRAARPASAWP